MPSIADIELAFYERFFFSEDIEPYPVQEQAFSHIFAGTSALVTVPTGTGKTMMAKAAIFKALEQGQRAVYTTPLRALTEEKYRELSLDFGYENVGFATGDFKINRDAPVQVEVAEILWNRIFGDRKTRPADVVIMDEGHYFNDHSRGYVWEESIIGLDPGTQLIMLSATIGHPDRFCHWVELTRRVPMALVESRQRRVKLDFEYCEEYLIDVVRQLNARGDVPAIIFIFGREKCFDVARLLKSCPRFTSDEERARIEAACDEYLINDGVAGELRPLLVHGIGIHHAGILPRYKQMVEELALERLLKFVVSTETIAAGINLPARTVVFPALRKHIKKKARLVTPAEFHQMAGRAGRPQFDTEGLVKVLAPEEVVQEIKKEIKTAKKKKYKFDEAKIRKSAYARARSDAQRRGDVTWDPTSYEQLRKGEPAELHSKTTITAEQVLAIGLPDLEAAVLPGAEDARKARERALAEAAARQKRLEARAGEAAAGEDQAGEAATGEDQAGEAAASEDQAGEAAAGEDQAGEAAAGEDQAGEAAASEDQAGEAAAAAAEAGAGDGATKAAENSDDAASAAPRESLPAYMELNIVTVVDNLLLTDHERRQAHKMLAQVTDNLRAIGVIDEHGRQVAGKIIGELQGMDGMFIYYVLMHEQLDYDDCRELVEYLIDHDTIQRILDRKNDDKRRDWIRERLRELRRENSMVSWDDVEAEYEREFPRPLCRMEQVHQAFAAVVPHPELHGGKRYKNIWALMEDDDLYFMEFVDKHNLAHEEGNLFSYLIRVMNFSKKLYEVTTMRQFDSLANKVRNRLAVIDLRLIDELLSNRGRWWWSY